MLTAAEAPGLTLERPELEKLTGYDQPKRMCAWLDAHRWAYVAPSRRGEIPKVSRAYAEARLAGREPEASGGRRRVGPSLDWMLGTNAP